jgi:hypothetical protein
MLRLTKEARHAFTCAQAEARRTAVDPAGELGLSDFDALRAIGIDLDEIRQRVEASFGPGALTRSVQGRRRARLADRAKEVWSATRQSLRARVLEEHRRAS